MISIDNFWSLNDYIVLFKFCLNLLYGVDFARIGFTHKTQFNDVPWCGIPDIAVPFNRSPSLSDNGLADVILLKDTYHKHIFGQ